MSEPDVRGANPVEYAFAAATVRDLAAADAVFDDLCSLAASEGCSVDAVTLGRKSSGEIRFHREVSSIRRSAPGVDLAAGLAFALFPSIGADHPANRAADRALLCGVAGRVSQAVGRRGLLELGQVIDDAAAAVIVAVPLARERVVVAVLSDAGQVVVRKAAIDTAALDRAAQVARLSATANRAGPRPGCECAGVG